MGVAWLGRGPDNLGEPDDPARDLGREMVDAVLWLEAAHGQGERRVGTRIVPSTTESLVSNTWTAS